MKFLEHKMTYKKAIIDIKTGEVSIEPMSTKENEAIEKLKAEQANLELEIKAKEAARQSALDKLAALGLSPEEISAITGA